MKPNWGKYILRKIHQSIYNPQQQLKNKSYEKLQKKISRKGLEERLQQLSFF
jgi:hypothetical protein